MTLKKYVIENLDDFIFELCQYQKCDNCSLGSVDSCVLRRCSDNPLDQPLNETECNYLNVLFDENEYEKEFNEINLSEDIEEV